VPWPDGIALTRRNPATHPIAASTGAESTHRNHPIFADIRIGNTQAIADFVTNPSVFQRRDEAGNTPLMQAAFYLDATQLDIFLKKGADPNATNRAGATALMKAVSDRDKVRTLLNHGAKPNVQSAAGNTALIIACRSHGAVEVVNELLAHGADVHASTPAGVNALVAATESGDEEVMQVLLARGANANATFRPPYSNAVESLLMVAVQYGHAGCVKLLLDHGADAQFTSDYGNALHFAAMKDRLEIARLLIEREVDVHLPARRIGSFRNDLGLTPLMYAAMTERDDPALVELLIEQGASVNAKTLEGETALGLAQKRGDTKIVAALKAAGGTAEAETAPSILSAHWSEEEVERTADLTLLRTAAADGLAILLKSGVQFADATANRCVTCHQHSQPAVAFGLAREKRLDYDDAVFRKLVRSSVKTAARRVESMLEEPVPVPSIGAWLLIGLHASRYDADGLTDGVAYSLARSQFGDGRWITKAARAPTDYSDVTSTALGLRALKVYSPPTMKKQFDSRIERAATWLQGVRATSTEERAFQILGLLWAGSDQKQLAGLINDLVQEQREDGGWAQLPKLKSDAYATGLTLYALNQGGGLSLSHPAYQKGTRFLLTEQRSDGSWFVATRASPVQVAVDDVFAHGKHQWISSSATTWATMALMLGDTQNVDQAVAQADVTNYSIHRFE
jgi:ankyrin repeat protein